MCGLMATLYSTIPKTQILLSKLTVPSGVSLAKLHRISLTTPLASLHHRHCSAAASISKEVEVGVRSPELVAAEYAELNLPLSNPQDMGLIRTRQHVNPLSASFSEPAQIPDWNKVFKDPKLPLMVDVGSGVVRQCHLYIVIRVFKFPKLDFYKQNILKKELELFEWNRQVRQDEPKSPSITAYGSGRFLLWLAKRNPSNNYLGLEIREKLVERAEYWVKWLSLRNIHFLFANATISFKELVSSYPGPLVLVSILCPDPHFKKRHHKRRVLQKPLAESIVDSLAPGGQVFIQSDVLQVAIDMRNQFNAYSDKLLPIDNLPGHVECDKEGWLLSNPMGIRTEREIHAESEGAEIYRRLYQKRI